MNKTKSQWCKRAQLKLSEKKINENYSYLDLVKATGYTREYLSRILNGLVYSENAIRKISDVLEIPFSESRPPDDYVVHDNRSMKEG